MSRHGTRVWLAVSLCVCTAAWAQFRSDDTPALDPPPPAVAPQPVDVVPRFAEAFRRSGQPRVVLMWNRALTDQAQARVLDEEVTRDRSRRADSASERQTQGAAESAKLKEADSSDERIKTVTREKRAVEAPQRQVKLSERHLLMLQRSFIAEMNRGGVRFTDRALAMRNTAALSQRQGGDAQLLEVLMVDDADAPAGYGFDVRAKDIHRGEELTSLYSRAVPQPRPQPPGAWVPAAAGYEFRQPPAAPPPTPVDVGAALARDVMLTLGGNLPKPPPTPARR